MRTMRETNRLLMDAIRNVMTEAQLDAKLPTGMTTRQLIAESALVHTQILPTEDAIEANLKAGPIKGYWHPHGYLSARKLNGEWIPLVVQGELL